MDIQDDMTCKTLCGSYKRNTKKLWNPLQIGWLKWNTNGSGIGARKSTTTGIVCRYNDGQIQYSYAR